MRKNALFFSLPKFSHQFTPSSDYMSSYVNILKNTKCQPPITTQKRPTESQDSEQKHILKVTIYQLPMMTGFKFNSAEQQFDFNSFLFIQPKSGLGTPRENLMVINQVRATKIA